MTRHTASTIDDEALDALYATLDDADTTIRVSDRPLYEAIAADLLRIIRNQPEPEAAPAEVEQLREQLAAAEQRARQAERIQTNADFHLGQEMARRQRAEQRAARAEKDRAEDDLAGACLARWEAEQETARYRTAWQSARQGRIKARTRAEEADTEYDTVAEAYLMAAGRADKAEPRITELENRLRLAHQARRAKEHQLDDIRRALCDAGIMRDDDPYSHADLADVIRQATPAATEATEPPAPDSVAEVEHETLIADVRAVMRGASNTEALHRAANGVTADDTPRPVSLATPCTNPECEHSLNWHTGTPGGVCVARGAACPCPGFQPAEDQP